MKKKAVWLITMFLLLYGCATTAHFTSTPDNATFEISGSYVRGTTPKTGSVSRTTFGKYKVKAEKEGCEPIYSILPLDVSIGTIAVDIALFAPALFFNIQRAFQFYEFDFEKGTIKYRKAESRPWHTYDPSDSLKAEVQEYFK